MLIKPSNKQIGAAYYSKTWLYLGLHMVSHSYFYHLYLILIPSMKLHWYFQCLLSLFLYLTNHFLYFLILAEPYFSSISSFLFVSNQFLTQQTLITHCIPLAHILVKNLQNLKSKPYYIAMVHGTVFSIKGCFGKVCDNILYFECLVLTFSCPPESVFDHQWRAVLLSFLFMSLISQIISHRNVFWSQDYKHFIP